MDEPFAWAICYTKHSWPGPYTLRDRGKVYVDRVEAQRRLDRLHRLGYLDCFLVALARVIQ